MLTPGDYVRCLNPIDGLVLNGLYLVLSSTPVAPNGSQSVTLQAFGNTQKVRWERHFFAARFEVISEDDAVAADVIES